jgi:serine/threonine protein kinase/Tol biopolymer transport system component
MDDNRWQRVWDAFQASMELPATQRHAYAQAALTDPEELDKLLAILARQEAIAEVNGESKLPASAGPATHKTMARQDWARTGQSFGRFVVQRPLGRGGMGEVYCARDTELNRTVALKFLSSGDIGNPESVIRFIREAQAASALNHPGIVTVFDVVRDGSAVGIVMELIDGVCMRAICGKPHPGTEVAEWGRQIATALTAAHATGIVHRDIKPENLMMRPDGLIKLLDFGLARHVEGSILNSVTPRIAGTLRYMSPEQVHGKLPKSESDIFSLGVVLYELATGIHPFASEPHAIGDVRRRDAAAPSFSSDFDALMAPYLITTSEPRPAMEVEPSVSLELSALLRDMLQKDPAKRPPAVAVAQRLHAIRHSSDRVSKTRRGRLTISSPPRVAMAAVALCVVLAGGIYWTLRKQPSDRAVPMVVEGLPLTGAPGNETNPAFSPDGRQIAYAWDGGSATRERSIYVRLVDGGNPLRLTSGAEDDNPVWSPDASKLAFLRYSPAGLQVMVVPALGGAQTFLGTVTDARLMGRSLLTWSPDVDELIIADSPERPGQGSRLCLYGLRISSRQRRRLTDPPEGTDDMQPIFSPNGGQLAFLRRRGSLYELHIMDKLGGPTRQLAAEPDVEGLAWSPDSRSLIFCTDAPPPRRVQVLSVAGGKPAPAHFQFGSGVRALVLSPASRRMAFVHEQKDTNVWALTRGDRVFRPLIDSTRSDEDPRISMDGRRIAFTSNRTGAYEIWVCERDGSNPHAVTSRRIFAGSTAWSPDDRTLAYDAALEGRPTEIWLVNADGGPSRRLMDPPLPGFIPNWSADGAWIYFVGKGLQIWKEKVAGGTPVQVTQHGGLEGFESFDGRYFYFVRKLGSPGIWRLPVAGGEEELLPELASVNPFRSWAMARDGIYYAESSPKPVLRFFQFRDRKTFRVADLPQPPQEAERGLSVSPDGSFIVYVQVDSIRNEILIDQSPL